MARRTWIVAAMTGVAVVLGGPAAQAEGEGAGPGVLTLRTERAVVFKDGYGLVAKSAKGTADAAGLVYTEDVPDAAVLGSFWALPGTGGPRLLWMDAGRVTASRTVLATQAPASVSEVLAWNPEQEVRLELDDGSAVVGTVRQVLSSDAGALAVLHAATGDVLLPVARIRRLDMKGMVLERPRPVTTSEEKKRLTFRFDGGAGERALRLLYFRPGIRWIPTYRVEVPGDDGSKEARVSLQAEILNEAEDLVDVPFDLVVGVPNFRFSEVVSPFVLEPMLQNALRQAAPQLMGQSAMSNAAFRSRAGERSRPSHASDGGAGDLDLPAELTATGAGDLFVYSLPPTTVKRGHRVAVPIFEARVPCSDVYVWQVDVAREDAGVGPAAGGKSSPFQVSEDRVWHALVLSNATAVPWTTGAAMAVRDGLPLAQELLTYTPRGAAVRLPLTVAVDVQAEYAEEETQRSLGALQWSGYAYARVDVTGRFRVTNHKPIPIDLEVALSVGGRADEASEGVEVTVLPYSAAHWKSFRGDPTVNNSSRVLARIPLAAGATVEPWVKFHYFLRQ